MSELADLSETDASNTSITTISIAEGCPPGNINNAIRAALGLLKRAFNTTNFRLRDSSDQTKLLSFNLSSLTTGTTTDSIPIITAWVAYTPTFVGMASPPQLKVYSRRNGPDLETIALWQNGTVSATTFTMTLGYAGSSGGITISNAWNSVRFLAGSAIWDATDYSLCVLAAGGDSVIRLGVSGPSNNSFVPALGSALVANTVISTRFSVPIQGW